jgi:hypothetical protein
MTAVDRIEYGYDAGSVPPMFYERLEVSARRGELRIRRWKGERAPVERSVPLTDRQFDEIVAALPALGLGNASPVALPADQSGPSGGSSEWARIGGPVEGDLTGLRDLLLRYDTHSSL